MAAKLEPTRHPGIYRKGGRYVVRFRERGPDGLLHQRKEFVATLGEALEAQGRYKSGEKSTARDRFEDYAREWLDTYRGRTRRGLSDSTKADYRRSIEDHAVPFFGRTKLGDIDPPAIRRFIAHLERNGGKPSSVRKRVAPLRALFATAFEDGTVRSNPTVGVRVIGHDEHDETPARALTRDELRRLLAALPDDWRLFFEFLAHTGLRISEAIGLRWSDVELVDLGSRIHVERQLLKGKEQRLKSRHSRRTVPLSRGMTARLAELRGDQEDDAPLFATDGRWHKGKPLDASNVRRSVLRPAAEDVGFDWPGFGFHTFRHTCASLLFAGGKNVKQVQEWLGHADPGFTLRRYVHLIDEGLGAAEFLDEAVTVAVDESAADVVAVG
jgi:integrase